MNIYEIIWLQKIVEKLLIKHAVSKKEVYELFLNQPDIRFVEKGDVKNEDLYVASGQTINGRYLVVFFVLKSKHKALVISARDMNKRERKTYEKK